eukprot:scaffold249020_cov28-Tisochrysis_lutea.AAC.2
MQTQHLVESTNKPTQPAPTRFSIHKYLGAQGLFKLSGPYETRPSLNVPSHFRSLQGHVCFQNPGAP